ncbi:ankyrin repeat domain-containing protein [Halogeometricum borinquense]|uniref:Ankyrin repeat-containing protein n=2 Tax=Halogeometricum borinquense TaxID=60847 RepID=E4NLC6_HALBP|nr:ankyrin repeat domain-containing protein [Halogeometricum borinquense]ADQ66022.1 ankyrin repeat-containing protein [Halogeometricum borinquense DSM 11551]ELY27481.1 ankyrin repeat-containing protein [Halogeometricum borinquense DSM 11551]QIB76204.1 ankyrin repeat domain-containing protein [Halogeometricum borinquense]QIQ75427.1 ankyrin repeat domain-containing protein [Halogeometricum borinquense]
MSEDKGPDDLYISTDIESAIIQGNTEEFDELIDDADLTHRSDNGSTLLHKAAGADRPEIARELIDRGIDLDAQNNGGHTALLHAIEVESYDTAEVLLEAGADPNIFDNKGRCPLSVAVTRGRSDRKFVKLLLEHGADPTATDESGESVLEWVKKHGITDVVELLDPYVDE